MDSSSIFGTIQPKPVYRTARGHFRKETPAEFRGRHDDKAWRFAEQGQRKQPSKKQIRAVGAD